MSRRGGGATAADPAWAPSEVALFFEAFHQHGTEFEQIAVAVGGGRTADACEALHRRHASYLAIPKEFQSVQAFTAMVENAQKEAAAEQPSSGGGEEGAGSGGGAGSRLKLEEEGEGEGDDAQASGRHGAEEGSEDGYGEDGEPSLAAGRSRRTPKRAGLRTPLSAAKRGRGDENIYEYYGEGADAVTESARKRRAPRGALEFPASQRRRHDTDEAKGIDALLALAVAGEESLGGMDSEDGGSEPAGGARGRKGKGRARTPQRRARSRLAEEEDEDYEPADAGEMDDDQEDEDFAPPASRRTPYSTPAKAGRLGRPGSAHVTPRRSGGRGSAGGVPALAAASPAGLALRGFSPFHMLPLETGGDMLTDLGLADLSYITSPGFPQLQQGFVPSPQNPMPRLRRRKSVPERVQPSVSSPIRTLFTRRSSLAGPLLNSFGYAAGEEAAAAAGAAGGAAAGSAGAPQSAAEAQLRHCLQQPRTQRWAAAEFCCSALDRPFFMFNPLSSLLTAMGLGQDARLTRKEWAIIRSGLGKPRRLSLRFLREERARLERWREGCREQYQSGAAAADPKVADHLPRPLGVGQRVVARHPSTRQLHDGSVLTVAHNCYRVQFDRQELGVELVRDTDVFPCDPTENLPPAVLLGASRLLLNGRAVINGQPVRPLAPPRPLAPAGLPAAAAAAAAASSTPLPASTAAGGLPPGSTPEPGSGPAAALADNTATAAAGQQQQARSADAKALAELVVGLDKKEALLLQLRAMNDEAAAGVHSADASGAAAPGFVGAYAGVVLQLKEVNDKVREKLEELESSGASGEAGAGGEPGAPGSPGSHLQHQQLGASLAADAALQRQLAAHSPEALSAAAAAEAGRIIAACRAKLEESAAAEQEEDGEGEEGLQAEGAGASGLPGTAAAEGQQEQQQDEQRGASPAAASSADAAAAAALGGEPDQQASEGPGQGPPPGLDWGSTQGQQLASLIQGCVHSLVLLQQGAGADGGLSPGALGAALDAALAAVAPREAANAALFEEVKAAMAGLKLQIGAVAS